MPVQEIEEVLVHLKSKKSISFRVSCRHTVSIPGMRTQPTSSVNDGGMVV